MRFTLLVLLLAFLARPVLAEDAQAPAASGTAAAAAGTAAAPAGSDNGGVPDLPTGTVYLLQEVHLTGSDFIEGILLTDKNVNSLDDCEKARAAGLTTGWPAFFPQLHNYEGLPSRLEYRCVIGEQKLTAFRYKAPLDYYYLMRINSDGQLTLEHYKDFFACRRAMGTETKDKFCSRMAQHIVE